jgi:glycosyltransferase involved in cell wall biosynthesis
MADGALRSVRAWAEPRAARLVHLVQRLRLRAERLGGKLPGRRARLRVMATACWDFPIYSQTFVYQELTQLIRNGVALRFLYSHRQPRRHLAAQFNPVWRARRLLILHPAVAARELAYYTRRMPARIDALVDLLSQASGLAPEEIRQHRHFLQAFAFTRLVEAYRPDYLHSYFFYEGSLFSLCASFLLGIPRGVSCYADHMLDDYDLKLVPRHLEQCRLVIATSARIKRELLQLAPQADAERILVKPNAINPAQFPIPERSEPRSGSPYRLVCVSRIEPKKGIIHLVEAVATLRDRGFNLELHLLGAADPSAASREYAADLEARLEILKLRDIVHLEGRQTEAEIQRYFARSHLYVAPFVETESGDKDGIPTALLEGMSSGLPVVATDAGSIAEVIEDQRDGLLVPQRNPVALADAIGALLLDRDRRARLGREAGATIRRRFDARIVETVLYQQVQAVVARRQDDGVRPLPDRASS